MLFFLDQYSMNMLDTRISPRNSPRQSAIAEGLAKANNIFKVITLAKTLVIIS